VDHHTFFLSLVLPGPGTFDWGDKMNWNFMVIDTFCIFSFLAIAGIIIYLLNNHKGKHDERIES